MGSPSASPPPPAPGPPRPLSRSEARSEARTRIRRRRRQFAGVVALAIVTGFVLGLAWHTQADDGGDITAQQAAAQAAAQAATDGSLDPSVSTVTGATPFPTTWTTNASTVPQVVVPLPEVTPTTLAPEPFDGWADPAAVGEPYGTTVPGLLTFRGNPSRTYYGAGPVPSAPVVDWKFAIGCSESSEFGATRTWCGSGWTGQPAVFERDGRTWVVFGAYDAKVHFLDAETGERILPDFPTGDIIKGSVTVDPDGYPLVYTGSRDNHYRVIAIDRPEPTELWRLSANDVTPVMWNNDWDGAGLVIGDHLFEGGENSQFHVAKLNRGYGIDGLVTVAPELVYNTPGWDDELLRDIGDRDVSIEGSVAMWNDVVYFANSGGLVQGWDLSGLREGSPTFGQPPTRVFRFWTGDDVDATVVVDENGFLYVGSEWERHTAQGRDVGQIMKLDPSRPDDPLVWSIKVQDAAKDGVWGTPALHRDMVYVPTNGGDVYGIDRATGEVRWKKDLPGPTWQSPVVVDDVLIQGDCSGVLHAYDVSDTTIDPPELWRIDVGGCIESTPAVWKGRIYLGTRGGSFHAITD